MPATAGNRTTLITTGPTKRGQPSTSDTMRKLSRGQILATPVPLPPLEEQERIVRRVAELSALCEELESQLEAARALRVDIAASVVTHAVSGPAAARRPR
ncbi:restriction endonuclease subunit S [Propioniciclava sinopodophylli]|uniref:restriction endonuclease subunit S n=1 Tax=Propioniciclava sinopodophylli TaxID=1837344 RepID=UPI003CD0D2DF